MVKSDSQKGAQHVGQILKRRRESLGWKLPEVELGTKIRGKYLISIEAGDYSKLPNDIYTRGFVQNYAAYLGLNDADIMAQYTKERGAATMGETQGPKLTKPKRFVITTKLIMAAVSVGMLVAIVMYLGWQFSALDAPPPLTITAPANALVVYGNLTTISGNVGDGANVSVNDTPVLTDANGNFSDTLSLQNGVNTIRITAQNKIGKGTTVVRSVLAHIPETGAQAQLPTATFGGVAVAVTTGGSATWITATVDGKPSPQLTMSANTTEIFTGKNSIVIGTGNEGDTSVAITNANVVNKNLGPLGHTNNIRRNVEYDTTGNY
jgi:cytoskeletal protein RodZ